MDNVCFNEIDKNERSSQLSEFIWFQESPPKIKQYDKYIGGAASSESLQEIEKLQFDYASIGRRLVLVSITLPDGGKITRKTEPAPGRDGEEGGYH